MNSPSTEPGGTIILSAEPGGTIIPRTEPGGILDYFEPSRPNGTTGQRLLYCHLPTSPIDLLSRPREATVASEGVYQIWDEPDRETPEQMERHEPQREESNELCDVAIEGEDDCGDPNDTEPICGRARDKARIINGFIRDEADSALREENTEKKRLFSGEGDNVDLAMIFDREERDVASDAIWNEVTIDTGLEHNEEIDGIKRKSSEDEEEPSPESQGSAFNEDDECFLIIYHENSSEDVEANVPPANDRALEGDDNLQEIREGEFDGKRKEKRSIVSNFDDDVEEKENNLHMPQVEPSGGDGDDDECPIDNFSEASSMSHDPRRRCVSTEKEYEGSERKGSADAIERNDRVGVKYGDRQEKRSVASEHDNVNIDEQVSGVSPVPPVEPQGEDNKDEEECPPEDCFDEVGVLVDNDDALVGDAQHCVITRIKKTVTPVPPEESQEVWDEDRQSQLQQNSLSEDSTRSRKGSDKEMMILRREVKACSATPDVDFAYGEDKVEDQNGSTIKGGASR